MSSPQDRRPAWQREGREPDYRFSLANERTFLAWIRTALAMLAGAVLFDQLALQPPGHAYVAVLAVAGSAISALMAALAYWRWKSMEMAMRHNRPLPGPAALAILTAVLFIAAAIVALLFAGLI